MTYQFQTSDLVCSRMIEIELDDRGERVKRVQFVGGCPGNLAGIARLAARDDARKSSSTGCRASAAAASPTSCPDQLATALREIAAKKNA